MKIHDTKRNLRWVAAIALSLLTNYVANAADAAPEKPKWETTAAAGLTITDGTKDTLLATAGINTSRKWEKDEFSMGVAGGYGQDDNNPARTNSANTEFVSAFAQYNHLFTPRFYGGLRLDFLYDGIANLDYRVTFSPLVGYYFVKTTNHTFAVEVGPAAVTEKYQGESSDTYFGIRFAERSEHKISDTTKIWQSASYVPQVDRWTENYVITAEAGIDTAITKKWSLRVVLQDVYTSEPGPGSEYNELRLIAGTAYKF
jgi:putative salt-induced outer membrane protein YdiY